MNINEIKINQVEVKDKTRKYCTEYIFTYVSDKNLTEDEFCNIANINGVWEFVKFVKKQLTFKSGQVLFKHICEVARYVD